MKAVLVVDDEPMILRSLSRILARAGFCVHTADNIADAKAILASHDIAVIISDQNLNCEFGVDLLAHAAANFPFTTRLLLSGRPDAEVAMDAVNDGEVFQIIWKPWDNEHIIDATRRAATLHYSRCDSSHYTPTPGSRLNGPMNRSSGE